MKKKGKFFKIGLAVGGGYFLLFFLVLLLTLLIGGGGGGSVGGIPILATEEQAYQYQYVGAEIGVPWDLALLADVFLADQNRENFSGAVDPVFTSLQFCVIEETKTVRIVEATGEVSEKGEAVYDVRWEDEESVSYYGLEGVLEYLGEDKSWLEEKTINDVAVKLEEIRKGKETEEEKYRTVLFVNDDFEKVLMDFVGLTEASCQAVLQLHKVHYLASLYGYLYVFDEIELPELVVGNVTRNELARVAVTLMNHPYMLGGKSPGPGSPSGPLDCSGYVDWVYIQCFGVGVSSGKIPEGVAVSGTALQWYASTPIAESEMQIGDLAFLYDPATLQSGKINHVGIYIGEVDGEKYFIHCAGRSYGTNDLPTGRVGISKRTGGSNNYNCVTGTTFEPAMKPCNFRYFRRPNFSFVNDEG